MVRPFSPTAIFAIPERLDRLLRLVICTPDMHRIHHSVIRTENRFQLRQRALGLGRLFGTFRRDPERGQTGLVLGLPDEQDQRRLGLMRLITFPFERRRSGS